MEKAVAWVETTDDNHTIDKAIEDSYTIDKATEDGYTMNEA